MITPQELLDQAAALIKRAEEIQKLEAQRYEPHSLVGVTLRLRRCG